MSPRQMWIRAFAELYLEVEAGLRPARHLRPLLHADVYPTVVASGEPLASDIIKIRSQARDDVCEAVVVLRTGAYIGALVVSVRRYEGRWQVTEVCRPETVQPVITSHLEELDFVQPANLHALTRSAAPGWTIPSGWRQPARAA